MTPTPKVWMEFVDQANNDYHIAEFQMAYGERHYEHAKNIYSSAIAHHHL